MKAGGIILLGLVTLLIGCGPSAHIERAANLDLNQYHSFAWARKSEKAAKAGLMEQRIKEAVSLELERNLGWKQTRRRPDVLLSYDLLVEKSSRRQEEPVYSWGGFRTFYNPYRRRFYRVYYPSRFVGYDSYRTRVREGTISVTMVDARNDKTLLQGWATDEIASRRITSAEVDRIIKAIFRKMNLDDR
ncbi:hypothetical protein GCM10027051_08700 [Niabella terrae]